MVVSFCANAGTAARASAISASKAMMAIFLVLSAPVRQWCRSSSLGCPFLSSASSYLFSDRAICRPALRASRNAHLRGLGVVVRVSIAKTSVRPLPTRYLLLSKAGGITSIPLRPQAKTKPTISSSLGGSRLRYWLCPSLKRP